MNVALVLRELSVQPSEEELKQLQRAATMLLETLKTEAKKQKLLVEIVLGGSFARGTLVKKERHDLDFFVRFDHRIDNVTTPLEKLVRAVAARLKLEVVRMHGSREYFRLVAGKFFFEIIPVSSIKHPREARNVTDLSVFHIGYVKRKMTRALAHEVALAKAFCNAQGVYGAESYIQGFSGYGLECLMIHYRSFEKMLRELVKVPLGGRLILDPAKQFKKKEEALFRINESKLQSPIILVDPTWKERNVLAALSKRTFEHFQTAARAFLQHPSARFFVKQPLPIAALQQLAKTKKAEYVHLRLTTEKQAGDIAGTKLKKFALFLEREINTYFHVLKMEFVYNEQHYADLYGIVKSRKEVIRSGPPLTMEKNALEFKRRNRHVFFKNGLLHARLRVHGTLATFLRLWKKKNQQKIQEMDIASLEIV